MCNLHFFSLLLVSLPLSLQMIQADMELLAGDDSYEYYDPEKLREYDSYYDHDEDEEETKEEEDEEDGHKHQGENASNLTENYYRWE